MIRIDKLKLFPLKTKQIRFPNVASKGLYSIIYYPENTNFIHEYEHLNILKQDVRIIRIVGSKYPKLMLTGKLFQQYRNLKLIPASSKSKLRNNYYFDCGPFLKVLETQFKIQSYRPVLPKTKVQEYLRITRALGEGTNKIFLYCIDVDEPLQTSIFQRRILPILEMYKQEEHPPFDYFLLCIIKEKTPIYTLLNNPNGSISYNRMYQLLKNIQSHQTNLVDHDIAVQLSDKMIKNMNINPLLSDGENEIIKSGKSLDKLQLQNRLDDEKEILSEVVKEYILAKPDLRKQLIKIKPDPDTVASITAKAILYSVSGNLKKSEAIVDGVSSENRKDLLDSIRKQLQSEIVERSDPQNNSRNIVTSKIDIPAINEYKDPSHVLNKRQRDFQNSFEKDLKKSFDLLGKKPDFPLKVESVKVNPLPVDPGDLEPSYEDVYTIILKDEKNRKHKVEIKIPHLMPDGTFTHKGKKKFLIYQIILDPIFFLKKWLVKLETLYAPMTIESKQMKSKQFLKVYISGYNMPLMALIGYFMGFNEGCKLFNIKYRFEEIEPEPDLNWIKLKDGKFIVFDYDTEYARQLVMSIKELMVYGLTEENILERKTYEEIIIKIVGNRNSVYNVNEVVNNIMEPVSVQVLKTKLLPFTLPQCILYMCKEVVSGRVDERNDLSSQRVRSSEVFNHQIIKLLLRSYNAYRFQRISGDNNAEYVCDTERVIKDIMNSKLVRSLENINPLEELSCLTRTTPIGPGGIPDKNAITEKARGSHPSYYGNLDPMDTPEGDTIGIINQLSVNAAITSSRGSFSDKVDVDEKAGVLGTSSVFIPFVNSDDGNRVQFSCSQSRQAVPIVGNEPALCQTGYESIMTHLLSDSYVKKASDSGVIKDVKDEVITIKLKNGKIQKIPLDPKLLNSAQGQSAINTFKSTVKVGQKVKENQIVAEGKHIINGTISPGVNLLTAIMGWKGYSFEDGYVISDSIIHKKVASKHYFEKTIILKKDSKLHFCVNEGQDTLKGEPLMILTSQEMEDMIGLDESDQEIIGGQRIIKSPGGKIISLEIYPNISIKKFPVLHNQFENFKKKYELEKGEFPKKFLRYEGFEKSAVSGIIVTFKLEDDYIAELGDKLANRHGNKGVITYIEKAENMPRSPWGDPVELCYNGLSIINRMNAGQLYELYISTISKLAAIKIVNNGPKKTQKILNYLSKIYRGLDNTKGQKLSLDVMRYFKSMNPSQWSNLVQQLINNNYILPIVVPQFQVPTRRQIQNVMKETGLKSAYNLYLPEYRKKTIMPVAVGWMYFQKLEQQSSIKLSARSTSMYQSKTMQPTAGKKSGGGQRSGEMDVNSLLSHGAVNVLKEFFGPLSDDQGSKNQIISSIIQTGSANYIEPRTSPTRDLLNAYMTGLGLE